MTRTVAMIEAAHDQIRARLDALALDIEVITFDTDARFRVGTETRPPEEVDIDYLWLTQHMNGTGRRDEIFEALTRTRSIGVMQTFNAGLDHPFYRRIADRGIPIAKSSAQGVAIAEYTIAQVLSLLHPIAEQRRMQAERDWRVTPFREISRTHWLIVGYGPIGQELAHRLGAFGARLSVIRQSATPAPGALRTGTLDDLTAFLPEADIVVLACPLNERTRGLAGSAFFAATGPETILVNVGRGGLVDDAALLGALDGGRLATAVLDVFHTEPLSAEDPLWAHPKVRLTPHTSFAGDGVHARWDQLFLDNIQRFMAGETLLNLADPDAI